MPEHEIMVFWLGEEEYGIDIREIHEISRLKEIVINRVPKVPEFIEGIINLRGDVVPVINTMKRLGIAHGETPNYKRLIVINVQSKLAGLLVDSISGAVLLEQGQVHEMLEQSEEEREHIRNIVKLGSRMIFLLDTGGLLGL